MIMWSCQVHNWYCVNLHLQLGSHSSYPPCMGAFLNDTECKFCSEWSVLRLEMISSIQKDLPRLYVNCKYHVICKWLWHLLRLLSIEVTGTCPPYIFRDIFMFAWHRLSCSLTSYFGNMFVRETIAKEFSSNRAEHFVKQILCNFLSEKEKKFTKKFQITAVFFKVYCYSLPSNLEYDFLLLLTRTKFFFYSHDEDISWNEREN